MFSGYSSPFFRPAFLPILLVGTASAFGAQPTPQDALRLRPLQQDVDYDKPAAEAAS